MSELPKIITNNHPRNILYWYELTDAEKKEHDYLNDDYKDGAQFVRYRGYCYYLSDFERINPGFPTSVIHKWHGFCADSYFSGILVRYTEDYEQVVMGLYLA
jgi:hypothetical protein